MDRKRALLVPLAILAIGVAGFAIMLATRPTVAQKPPVRQAPLVRVLPASPIDVVLEVDSQGNVEPRTQSDLIPEVSGSVIWVSPKLASGEFFDDGELLFRIDTHDYEVAMARARAQLARAESENARASREATRQRGLAERDYASSSQLDDAENAEKVANAQLAEARAQVAKAERDLERTHVRAPYTGRVREENIDVGQFVNRGNAVAKLYAIEFAEVRLPISDEDLAYLDLPLWYRGGDGSGETWDLGPSVRLHARFAGAEHEWQGQIVRTEGEIDDQTRMVHVIARVKDPYGRSVDSLERPPLAVGLFVEAEIEGRLERGVLRVPRRSLQQGKLLIADAEDRMRLRDAELVKNERENVIVRANVLPGDRIIVSSPRTAIDGMLIKPEPSEPELSS
ncbi:efflux RND transporter periplasmic adaptor subunit [Myxococcota bacterium]|nr:efflux RND transporter periplasmic adaptor subunit [Myxococcota bacterium]